MLLSRVLHAPLQPSHLRSQRKSLGYDQVKVTNGFFRFPRRPCVFGGEKSWEERPEERWPLVFTAAAPSSGEGIRKDVNKGQGFGSP